MMKKFLIFFLLLFLPLKVFAITNFSGKCVQKNINLVGDDALVVNNEYSSLADDIYKKHATISLPYSKISCQDYVGLETTGVVDNVLSGTGFDYNVRVVVNKICTGVFDNKYFTNDYPAADGPTKAAMNEEIALYIDWTNNLSKKLDDSNIEIFFDDLDSGYKEIDRDLVLKNKLVEEIKNVAKDNSKTVIKINGNSLNYTWIKGYTYSYDYTPSYKKMILSGNNYGEIIKESTNCTDCSISENKIFTNFNMGNGSYKLDLHVNDLNKKWSIVSECGYIINNGKSKFWNKRLGYRTISLANPFPNGIPNNWQNWKEKKLITGNEYKKEAIYVANLDRNMIKSIREYNNTTKYLEYYDISSGNYSDNKQKPAYKSDFIHSEFAKIFSKAGDD